MAEKRVYLKELEKELDRRMNTIRLWEEPDKKTGKIPLPVELHAHRDEKNWRYWTPVQVKKLKAWMKREGRAPGVGLRNVDPSPAKTQEILASLRKPRPDRRGKQSTH